MPEPYLCPSCNSNRTWFNKINQSAQSMKLEPKTGETLETFPENDGTPPFHFPYNGPPFKIQCGICGLIADENMFIKNAQHNRKTARF